MPTRIPTRKLLKTVKVVKISKRRKAAAKAAENARRQKEAFNAELRLRYRQPIEIGHVYSPNTRVGPRSVGQDFIGVKLANGMKGWLNVADMKFWTFGDTVSMLKSLDRLAAKNEYAFGDPSSTRMLQIRFDRLSADKQVLFSRWMSEQDWTYLWEYVYDSKDHDDLARKNTLYDEALTELERIEAM